MGEQLEENNYQRSWDLHWCFNNIFDNSLVLVCMGPGFWMCDCMNGALTTCIRYWKWPAVWHRTDRTHVFSITASRAANPMSSWFRFKKQDLEPFGLNCCGRETSTSWVRNCIPAKCPGSSAAPKKILGHRNRLCITAHPYQLLSP